MIVVTGAAGFIGATLVMALAKAGERVVAVDRRPLPRAATETASWVLALRADLLDPGEAVPAALRAADAVFHLAGRPGVRDRQPAADLLRERDNVLATARVLRHVPLPTPLVVTSSSAVYGGSRHGRPCRESDPPRPLGGYARSKAAMERLCARRLAQGGLVAIARPFTVVGEGQRPDMAVARWIAAARAGRPLVLHGSASRTRDLTDVHDVVRALRLMAEREVAGVLNVGTGVPRPLAEIASAVCRAVGRSPELVLRPAVAEDPAETCADTELIEGTLGFRPQANLAEVIGRQVAATGVRPVRATRSGFGPRRPGRVFEVDGNPSAASEAGAVAPPPSTVLPRSATRTPAAG